MDGQEVAERIQTLTSSENRHGVLAIVCSNGPVTRDAVERRINASRRTVKRALETLAEQGYVRADDGRYRPTPVGRLVYEAHRSFQDSVELAERLEPVLGRIPDGEFDLDPEQLADATVKATDDGSPYRPLERVLELRRGADRIRELSSIVEERSVKQLKERLDGGAEIDVEFVLTADAAARAQETDAYAPVHQSIMESDAVNGYIYAGSFPFVLGIFDDTVVIGADEEGLPRAIIESDDAAVKEWAEGRYETYRSAADSLPEPPRDGG